VLLAAGVRPTEPSAVPPLVQPVADGPHTKKLTLPVGLPNVAFPFTVALSVFEPPIVIVAFVGLLVMPSEVVVTVKHSLILPSLEDR
jgi:hypothetical protein